MDSVVHMFSDCDLALQVWVALASDLVFSDSFTVLCFKKHIVDWFT